ncbi:MULTISPECIES: type VII secretion protein EccE [unclassified Mycobacterium]|uniref:type VII secretion protein EccE n=1 Tax=unclassified Mycobacterium TaxID=2642494 RepID=UPI0029C6CDFF|nr:MULTISPECIES: type VII secretion protein EccE [unclassified Mycobacterium]
MTIRIALALSAIVLATLAHPWQSLTERWVLGGAVVVVLAVFAWWRGLFVTTMIRRRVAVWRRNHSKPKLRPTSQVTVLMQVADPARVGLPLPVVASYVDRFGVRCNKIRVTSLADGDTRATWIGITLDAGDNLAALAARSPELPLSDTAEVVGRRLADHLRELGLEATIVDDAAAPLNGSGKESWSRFRDDVGYLTAYGLPVDESFTERIGEARAQQAHTWTALEFSGSSAHPTVAAACAFRTQEPLKKLPVPGLVAQRGVQRPLLAALDPRSVHRLGLNASPLGARLLDQLGWPSVEHEVAHEPSHPA